jgi:hypothetical protein
VLQGPDIIAMNSLTAAMPPVCRARLGDHDGHELAMSALGGMVDAATRTALPPGADLLPPRRGRRPRCLPAAEAWLTALTVPDGRFDADAGELDALVELLRRGRKWAPAGSARPGRRSG